MLGKLERREVNDKDGEEFMMQTRGARKIVSKRLREERESNWCDRGGGRGVIKHNSISKARRSVKDLKKRSIFGALYETSRHRRAAT